MGTRNSFRYKVTCAILLSTAQQKDVQYTVQYNRPRKCMERKRGRGERILKDERENGEERANEKVFRAERIAHLITNSIKMNASSETNSTYLH